MGGHSRRARCRRQFATEFSFWNGLIPLLVNLFGIQPSVHAVASRAENSKF
jgi:hypothetical protein